ncbi:uncharacterized protein K02A2.6-like [Sycon ciliatum]|uniref:uncharacterized protein K02A2.6-like n=1 Tax=Sycon ciliatum TaxID=27933 RepID=UPI0031F67B31
MSTVKSLNPFDLEPPESVGPRWEKWLARFDNYLIAANITEDERQRAQLLHGGGEDVFDVYLTFDSSSITSYDDLKDALTAHFSPKRNREYEVYLFRREKQSQSETLDSYVTRLRRLGKHCQFADMDTELKSQVVQHCVSSKVREKAFMESSMSLADLLTYARSVEVTMSSVAAMAGASSFSKPEHPQVHKVERRHPSSRDQPSPSSKAVRKCSGCGGKWHDNRSDCPAWGKTCKSCSRSNHFAKVCRSKAVHQFSEQRAPEFASPDQTAEYSAELHHTSCSGHVRSNVDPYMCSVSLAGTPVVFEIDTGAAVTIINKAEYQTLASKDTKQQLPSLETNDLPSLRSYAGKIIPVIGRLICNARHAKNSAQLTMFVVEGSGPNLLGRDALQTLKLNWNRVFNVTGDLSSDLLSKHPDVFKPGLGTWKHGSVKLAVDRNARPRFLKARSVPYALQSAVEKELDKLVDNNVIQPVEFAEWAAPIVPVLKSNGQVRICGDYKCTVNQAAKTDKYPLPNIEDLYVKLANGRCFTKLDLSQAYLQLPLDEQSKLLTTINTTKGLFVYNRLPFGVSSAPSIFQRTLDQLLAEIPMVVIYLDDILVSGTTREEHDKHLNMVLERLNAAGLRLNRTKCSFARSSVTFLGHIIDASGIKPTKEKVQDVIDARAPTDVQELRSYLGLINYYHKFIPNLSSVLAPLYELLSSKSWDWSHRQQSAFESSKKLLIDSPVRVHYDPKLPIIVSCDASPYGIGAVLSHVVNGEEHPVIFASRTLSSAERNYAQIEKEGLAMVFAVKRFHKYLYGQSFTLQTDHKPLLGLFSECRPVPAMASGRIQRWALMLANYDYELQYKPGKSNGNADGLSRLPAPTPEFQVPVPAETVLSMTVLDGTPVTSSSVAQWSRRDPVLALVLKYVQEGWPNDVHSDYQAYYRRRSELSIIDGCLLLGSRVVIPPQGREKLLEELHFSHPGITRMKSLARSYVWWPSIDAEIELKVRSCEPCQATQKSPALQPLHPWEWPGKPWTRLHIDYAGPVEGKMLLVIVDSHSKYIDVHAVPSATSTATIGKLRECFATHGLPQQLVSDNGSVFTSSEFQQFCSSNGIKHTLVSPYHPASNGLAERAVQTVKSGLKKLSGAGGDLASRLHRFLFHYRLTPQSTTGQSPFQLLMNRTPRSRLDLTFPDTSARVLNKQGAAVDRRTARASDLCCGDAVWVINFTSTPKWMPGVLEECLGPATFTVRLDDGRIWKRHADHIRRRLPSEGGEMLPESAGISDRSSPPSTSTLATAQPPSHTDAESPQPSQPEVAASRQDVESTSLSSSASAAPSAESSTQSSAISVNSPSSNLRRSTRSRKSPDRMNL